MNYSDILVDDDEGIRTVRLNRPEALNSVNLHMLTELRDALAGFARDAQARALMITGEGDAAFCAGGDIKDMERMGAAEARSLAALAHRTIGLIEGTGKPIVSVVNGIALGAGCDLALACDICTASAEARFGMPSLNLGVITPFGGMSRLMTRVGASWARYLIYTGRVIDAKEARSLGMIQEVFDGATLMQESDRLTRRILEKAPVAFALSKRLLRRNESMMMKGADALEVEYYARCFKTRDQKEGANAFRMKRKPVFTGK